MLGVKLKIIYFICIVLVVQVYVWKINGQTLNMEDSKSTTHLNLQTSIVTIYHSYTFRFWHVLKRGLTMFF